ncbi:YhgE/Pip family protein [Cellulomonas soli]
MGDGAQTLADALADGAAQIPDDSQALRTDRAEVISAPVTVADEDMAKAEGFGEGFAPFFIPLALFVGALITWLLLRPLPTRALATPINGLRTAFSGYLPALALGVAQVAVMLGVIHYGVGLQMHTTLGTIGFTLLVAATFLAVQQALMALLGPAAGKVAVLALLMLQPGLVRWHVPGGDHPGVLPGGASPAAHDVRRDGPAPGHHRRYRRPAVGVGRGAGRVPRRLARPDRLAGRAAADVEHGASAPGPRDLTGFRHGIPHPCAARLVHRARHPCGPA